MLCDVGAIAIVYEEQKQSSIEMIKSFREFNPNSTIVIYADGNVSNINDISNAFNCEVIQYVEKIGYPASYDIEIPLKYLYRFLTCSFLIKEKYLINLEPDCLVKDHIQIDNRTESTIISHIDLLDWIFFLGGDCDKQKIVIDKMQELYKKYNVYIEPMHDKIIGGGGHLYNVEFCKKIIFDWQNFVNRSYEIKKIYEECAEIKNICWFQDVLISLNLMFYGRSDYGGYFKPSNLGLDLKIEHPYKKFYV